MKNVDTPVQSARHEGIDVARFFAFIGVVFIHTSHMGWTSHWAAAFGRFAVPLFFLMSGYLLSTRATLAEIVWKQASRLIPPFAFWVVAFMLVFRDWPTSIAEVIKLPIAGGPAFHLWFLPALGVCVAITAFIRQLGWPVAFAIALVLYVAGLAMGSYGVFFGEEQHFWNPRNGPFFGLLFVVLGGWIRASGIQIGFRWAAVAFVLFSAAHMVEQALLFRHPDGYADFFILTVPVGVAALFAAMSMKPPAWLSALLAPLGRISLGLYGVHAIFVLLLIHIFNPAGVASWLGIVAAVILLSIAVVWPMSKVPYLRRVVA